jgi:hypothetical protein
MMMGLEVEGQPAPPPDRRPVITITRVTPDYFRAMGMHLLLGRQLTDADAQSPLKLGLINQTMARRFWPHQDPVGKRFRLAPAGWITVVGETADVRHEGLDADVQPEMYGPVSQSDPLGFAYVALRTAGDPLSLVAPARRVVRPLDKTLRFQTSKPWSNDWRLHGVRDASTCCYWESLPRWR